MGISRSPTHLHSTTETITRETSTRWVLDKMAPLAPTLKAGEYQFPPHISLRTVINKLATADVAPERTLTIPEGFTVKQAINRISTIQGLTGQATTPEEGMLFPDTYHYTYGTPRQKLLGVMQQRMEKELTNAWQNRTPNLPINTPNELLILASIIQKEAANEQEMPTISSVFINRLNKKMRLQSDPTVIYGAEITENNIRKKDLTEAHPFNTYIYPGLPPTPIANPGRAALLAAANPASTTFLFFVSNPSRTEHIFSQTYAEHQKHVKAYWKYTDAKPSK
ncbi:MAG: endolytic transglycosylase MltG [Bacteroidetes bacterium]|nr:endolytic transglycosylase MltG [Bacteroidota bacterium]